MPAEKSVKWVDFIYHTWIVCLLRNLFARKSSSPLQTLLLPTVYLQAFCTAIFYQVCASTTLISKGKFCDCCGAGRSKVCARLRFCIHPRWAAGALTWSCLPCQQIRKGLGKRRIPREASFHICTAAILQLASASICSVLYMWHQQGRCTERNQESLEEEGKFPGTFNYFIVSIGQVCKTTAAHMGRLD